MNWNMFTIEDLFIISPGKRLEKRNMKDGIRPFVGASDSNNGITGFVSNENESLDNHVLGINYNGSVCEAFYHPYECIFSDDVKRLHLKCGRENGEILLFTGTSINKQKCKYEYGYKFNGRRMKRQTIMLPIDEDGSPDWQYMNSYMETIRNDMMLRYEDYAKRQLSKLEYKHIPLLKEMEWLPCYVADIFTEIERGKRLKKADHIPGKTPYVSSSSANNGVDAFITGTPGTRVFRDCISLANSGSVGSTFYEPFSFVASDHVTHLKHEGFSKWIYLFLSTVIEKQSVNFNFNREINDARIRKMKIMLPVDANGKPDYAYMEQYAKNMMIRKYRQYLEYTKHKAN